MKTPVNESNSRRDTFAPGSQVRNSRNQTPNIEAGIDLASQNNNPLDIRVSPEFGADDIEIDRADRSDPADDAKSNTSQLEYQRKLEEKNRFIREDAARQVRERQAQEA